VELNYRNKIKKLFSRQKLAECGTVLFGGVLFGVSMNLFFLPGKIILGGVTGITTVLNILFGLPAGVMNVAINIPLVLVTLVVFGWRFIARAAIGIVITATATDMLCFLPISTTDPLLCAILGGITMGAGCGLMFSYAYTTGGTDFVAWVLGLRFVRISTGKLIMIVDFFVIVGAAIVMKSSVGVFYSIIALFVYTVTIDYVMKGAERAKLAFIFSYMGEEVASVISSETGQGVTLLCGRGWYSKKKCDIVVCALKKTEAHRLAEIVSRVDGEAFAVFADVSRIETGGLERGTIKNK